MYLDFVLTVENRSTPEAMAVSFTFLRCDQRGWQMYAGRVRARTQRIGAAVRESPRRNSPVGLTSLAFHACGSASPFRTRSAVVTVAKNRTSGTPTVFSHVVYICRGVVFT
jgi:hypothetical protein